MSDKKFISGLRVEELLGIYLVDQQAGAILGIVNPSANVTRLMKGSIFKKYCRGITFKGCRLEPWEVKQDK